MKLSYSPWVHRVSRRCKQFILDRGPHTKHNTLSAGEAEQTLQTFIDYHVPCMFCTSAWRAKSASP